MKAGCCACPQAITPIRHEQVEKRQQKTMRTEYTAQIRKLRLPEQDELKNESERCSADPVMLESIGRALGQQVRIKRSDGSGFVALYTVKHANPDADLSDPEQAGVVRTGQTGRERLGSADETEATVQAKVGGKGVIGIANAKEAPSATPAEGGVLFVEDGALKYRGSEGTVKVIAPA
jgi:hypothetical protein